MRKRIVIKKATKALLLLLAGPEKRAQRKMKKDLIALRKCKWFDQHMQERFRELGEQVRNAPIIDFTT